MSNLPHSDAAALSEAVSRLRAGGVVAFPTETVYGLGAVATDAAAVRAVFALKGRPSDNPLIVHVASIEGVGAVAEEVSEAARRLMEAFWPGPLTLVLPRGAQVPDEVTGGLDTVAVRMPDHPLALALIEGAGALVAPSANLSGRPSPTEAAHVLADFGDAVPVLDGGRCRVGVESTVVDVRGGQVVVLRPGRVGAEALSAACGLPVAQVAADPARRVRSPGMKYRHYAPRAEVGWLPEGLAPGHALGPEVMAVVLTRRDLVAGSVVDCGGSLEELARCLYGAFRQADALGLTRVLVEPFEVADGDGLAAAVRNRLEKAIARV